MWKNKPIFSTTILFISCFLLFSIYSHAQNGSLDISFGMGGKIITDIGSQQENVRAVAIQSDGKILVAGESYNGTDYDFALVRYTTNGALDSNFGMGGIVITDIDSSEYGLCIATQTDGKIVVAGYIVNQDFALVRYKTDGTLDTNFGNAGKLITNITGTSGKANAVVIQNDGKIVVAGAIKGLSYYDIVLIRYNNNGTLDSSFANGGIQITDIGSNDDYAHSVALQPDGKIVLCGASIIGLNTGVAVLRYNTNGTLDNSFGIGGIQTTAYGPNVCGYSIAIQNDGKIVVGGETINANFNRDFVLLRYNSNGTLDNTFGNGGISNTLSDSLDYSRSVAIQGDGKIMLGGRSKGANGFDIRLDCYNTDGTLDNTFGNAGIVMTDFSGNEGGVSLAIQNDGKIVMAGFSITGNNNDFMVARYIYSSPDGINSIENQIQKIKGFPNPFSGQATFRTNIPLLDATFIAYNNLGQEVRQIKQLTGNEIKFYRDNLPIGLYTVKIIQENRTIATGNIVVGN